MLFSQCKPPKMQNIISANYYIYVLVYVKSTHLETLDFAEIGHSLNQSTKKKTIILIYLDAER